MENYFKAFNGKNKVNASTPEAAAELFLQRFKNRTFTIWEIRNGSFSVMIGPEGQSYGGCKSWKFKSRDEAREFIKSAKAAA